MKLTSRLLTSLTPGALRSPATPILSTLENLYRWGVRRHQARFEGLVRAGTLPHRLPCRVFCVGNIVAGGSGKTPIVEALAREWLRRGGSPAILSRGYGSGGAAAGNDEFQLLRRRLPEVPHYQDRERFEAGRTALREHPDLDLLILDDGFQHRRLHRDVDAVVIDATRPFGYGHCLPRGLLREPWQGLERADCFFLTRTEDCSKIKVSILETFLRQRFPGVPRIRVNAHNEGLLSSSGPVTKGKAAVKVAAFAGIGNPDAFFQGLERQGYDLVGRQRFPDHYRYQPRDLLQMVGWAQSRGAQALVCTEKDGVKLEKFDDYSRLEIPCWQSCMRVEFDGADPLSLLPSE